MRYWSVKTRKLLGLGVSEVWLIDRERGAIEIHRTDRVQHFQGSEAADSEAIAGFQLIPAELFAQ